MADNITITQGSGTTMGTDDVSGIHYPRQKIVHGADGSNDGDTCYATPFPISEGRSQTQEDLVTKAYSFFTASFQALSLSNIATSTHIYIWNDTDANLLFNWDNGANSEIILPARAARTLQIKNGASELYAKYASAPSSGNAYFEVRK